MSSSSVPSAHVIGKNTDLLSEFLLHLPIKTLLNFKSVSKQWLSCITDPDFCRRRSLKPDSASFEFLQCNGSLFRGFHFRCVSLNPLQTSAPLLTLSYGDCWLMEFVQSCNGLLCFCHKEWNMVERSYFICNPTTNQFKTLPPLDWTDSTVVRGVNLAFEPSKSHVYHVLCIRRIKSADMDGQILVYSSETGAWRVSRVSFVLSMWTYFSKGVYWNGGVHWRTDLGKSMPYFDLAEDIIREMPMPPISEEFGDEAIRYFGQCAGHLHLIVEFNGYTKYHIYELEMDRSSWSLKFSVSGSDLMEASGMYPGRRIPHCRYEVIRGEREEDAFLVMVVQDRVIRYNFKSRTYQAIQITDEPLPVYAPIVFHCILSLAPV